VPGASTEFILIGKLRALAVTTAVRWTASTLLRFDALLHRIVFFRPATGMGHLQTDAVQRTSAPARTIVPLQPSL
jgi:hypothetical protein